MSNEEVNIEMSCRMVKETLARIKKVKHLDVRGSTYDERLGEYMLMCIQEGFNQCLKEYGRGEVKEKDCKQLFERGQ